MRKRIAAVMVCLAIAAISISGTMAYFTADSIATNVITSGRIDITLIEKDDQGNDFVDKTGVMPGEVVPKIVTVRNAEDAEAAFIRIEVTKVIKLAEGVEGTPNTDYLICDYNFDDWTLKDGYFYYNYPLAPGEETKELFTTVTFNPEMGNMYQGCRAEITVKAEAVQVKNNKANAVSAVGWNGVE